MISKSQSEIKIHERRAGRDRRARPTNPFSLVAYRGRRKTIRRKSDRRTNPYTELYSRRLLLTALLITLLCVADALFTIFHVTRGSAVELNPFMDVFLEKDPFLFFGVKFFLSSFCIVILVVYRYNPLARTLIYLIVAVYSALFCYQLFFFFF